MLKNALIFKNAEKIAAALGAPRSVLLLSTAQISRASLKLRPIIS